MSLAPPVGGRPWPGSTIIVVVDGDTFDIQVRKTVSIEMDFGFGLTPRATMTLDPIIRMRLNRANCPPGKTSAGRSASARVRELCPFGPPLFVETFKAYKFGGPANSPGEWMAEIWLDAGRNLTDVLVAEGLAVYWDGQGPRPGGVPLYYDAEALGPPAP